MKKLSSLVLVLATLAFVGVMSACGGTGSTPPPPPTTYTVSASTGTGTTASPAATTVTAGGTATFTVGLQAGYEKLVATGCTLTGTTCTTGPINSNTTVSFSATKIPVPTYTATATAGAGIASIAPNSQSGTAGSTETFAINVATGYQNPTFAGNCVGALSGTTYIVTLGSSNCSFTATATPITVTAQINTATLEPQYVFDTDLTSTPVVVEVATQGTGFNVVVTPYTGEPQFSLKDDGSNGDKVAGDGIYSGTFTPGVSPTLDALGNTEGRLSYNINMVDAKTGATLSSSYIELGVVSHTQLVDKKFVTQLAGGAITMAPNAIIFSHDPSMSQQDVMKAIYQQFPDVFDLVLIKTAQTVNVYNSSRDYEPIRQDVTGIGNQSVFDSSASFGSNSKLRGIIRDDVVDADFSIVPHEIAHTYAFYLDSPALDLTRGNGMHMEALATFGDQLSNHQMLVEQPSGDFLITPLDSSSYADLTLYLLGFESASEMPTNWRFVLSSDYLPIEHIGSIIPRSATTPLTIGDIQAHFGVRSPDSTKAQHDYRMLIVMDLPLDEMQNPIQPTDAEIAAANTAGVYYASKSADPKATTFDSLTKHKGTLTTAVPAHK